MFDIAAFDVQFSLRVLSMQKMFRPEGFIFSGALILGTDNLELSKTVLIVADFMATCCYLS